MASGICCYGVGYRHRLNVLDAPASSKPAASPALDQTDEQKDAYQQRSSTLHTEACAYASQYALKQSSHETGRYGKTVCADGVSDPSSAQLQLHDISCIIRPGERIALVGKNGVGKSSLARILHGAYTPCTGTLTLDDMPYEGNIRTVMRRVGMVMQDPTVQVVAPLVLDDVIFGPCSLNLPETQVRMVATEMLETVGLSGFEHRSVASLSGGELQRLALAGVMALHPDYLVLDEAGSMLDPSGRAHFDSLLTHLHHQGVSLIQITHAAADVRQADRVFLLRDAGLSIFESPQDFFEDKQACASSGVRGLMSLRYSQGECLHKAMSLRAQEKSQVQPLIELHHVSVGPYSALHTSSKVRTQLRRFLQKHSWKEKVQPLVSEADVSVMPGDVMLISGPSGAGKTTLLQAIAGVRPCMSGKRIARGQATLVLQHAMQALFCPSVLEEVAYASMAQGVSRCDAYDHARTTLMRCGLNPRIYEDQSPATLSGGEARRVALAAALDMPHDVLCLDEPTAGLDHEGVQMMVDIIHEAQQRGRAVVVVSHDIDELAPLITCHLRMEHGRVIDIQRTDRSHALLQGCDDV